MKRIDIALALILFCFVSKSFAQKRQVLVGAVGGVAYTNLPNQYTKNFYGPKFNPHYGLLIDIPIGEKLFIGSGVLYRKKSRILTDPIEFTDLNGNTIGEERTEFYSKSLTIPVFISYSTGNKIQIRFGLGGFYGRVFEIAYYYDYLKIEGQDNPFILSKQFARYDFGALARVAVYFPIYEKLRLNIDLTEEFGLKNINSVSKQQALLGKMTTQSLSLGIGIAYGF